MTTYLLATLCVRGNGSKMADQQVVLADTDDDEIEENAENDGGYVELETTPTPDNLLTNFR